MGIALLIILGTAVFATYKFRKCSEEEEGEF
jgi:hypothetical protein